MTRLNASRSVCVLFLSACLPTWCIGQAAGKKPLTYAAAIAWKSIQGTVVSSDGRWSAFAIQPQEGDGELVVQALDAGTSFKHPRGSAPAFTPDSKFCVFTIAPAKADVDKARKEKKPPAEMPKAGLGWIELATGKKQTVERVKSFAVPVDGPALLAYHKEAELKPAPPTAPKPPESGDDADQARAPRPGSAPETPRREPGTTLVVRDLATGAETSYADVSTYLWSREAGRLACVATSAKPEEDGIFVREASGETRRLLSGEGAYRQAAWNRKGDRLAFLSNRAKPKADPAEYRLYLWKAGAKEAEAAAGPDTAGVPKGQTVSENGVLRFSSDGDRLFFGVTPIPPPKPKDPPEPVNVDLWSWTDDELQTVQKVRATADRQRSYAAVLHLGSGRVVPLGGPDLRNVAPGEDERYALASDDQPYRKRVSWDTGYADHYLVDLRTGARDRFLSESAATPSLSPGGKYVAWYSTGERAWFARKTGGGPVVKLTGKAATRFDYEEWDSPSPAPGYGMAGWLEGDQGLVVYDRFDLWLLDPNGGPARNLTGGWGRSRSYRLRYERLDPEERALPAKGRWLLSVFDEATKASGYAALTAPHGDSAPELLALLDKSVEQLRKAKSADRVLFTLERFDEFPDLWTSDLGFRDRTRLTDANPQQKEYVWGRSSLISTTNADGKSLKAILTLPEDYNPLKRYPVMVYIYERLTDGLHQYSAPGVGTSINFSRYASNGYVLLRPDIVYDTGYPGESAMKCVLPAVQKLIDDGIADPKRIGIMGHSWGGYQITYLVTRTNLFRAVSAGASVSNMVSAYGGIRYQSGLSRAFQYERSQSRIGGPPWARPLQFIEHSPVFWADKVQTPYLTMHNDNDGAVPWTQAIEFYTALRRLGRECYLFNYNGEGHGLANRANMKHWTVHQDEFFDHYLLGKPRPKWMDEGVPFLERGTREIEALFR